MSERKSAKSASSVIIVGGGVFGVTAALELIKRGHSVQLFEAHNDVVGTVNPLAGSSGHSR